MGRLPEVDGPNEFPCVTAQRRPELGVERYRHVLLNTKYTTKHQTTPRPAHIIQIMEVYGFSKTRFLCIIK